MGIVGSRVPFAARDIFFFFRVDRHPELLSPCAEKTMKLCDSRFKLGPRQFAKTSHTAQTGQKTQVTTTPYVGMGSA